MFVRVLELLTHIHSDYTEGDEEPLTNQFSCLGYFDAMNMVRFEYGQNENRLNIFERAEKEIIKNIDGRCTRKTLICINKNVEKEKNFWEVAEGHNLLFVSVIRLIGSEKGHTANIITSINQNPSAIAYLTYDASEMVLFKAASSYKEGMEFVVSLRNNIPIYRVFSVMAIKENFVPKEKFDEIVDCRLHASVKEMKEVNVWLKQLEEILSCKCKCFHTLGEKDLLIEIENVSTCQILPLYLGVGLLCHGNVQFQKAFFEMQSEFLKLVER